MSLSCLPALFYSVVRVLFFRKNSFPSRNVSGLEFLFGSYSVVTSIFVLDFTESDFLKKDCNGS